MPIPRIDRCTVPVLATALVLLFPGSMVGQTAPAQLAQQESGTPNFEALAKQATAAREEGKTEEAIHFYEGALQHNPDWTDGLWYLGTLYADAGRYNEAIPAFQKVTTAYPKLGPAWAYLGLCEFETKDYKSSLRHLQDAKQFGFAEAPGVEKVATYHLALLLNLNGQFEDAWELLASKLGRNQLAEQTKTALALALLRVPLLPDQVDPSKDALIDAAGETAGDLAEGNFDRALLGFQQMLKAYPTTPFLHYAYGSALIFRSRYPEAEAQLREEVRLTPKSALPLMRLAIIAMKQHRAQDALPIAERAVQLAPDSALAHELLGRILSELGKPEQAAKESEAAEKLKPEKPDIDLEVAKAYAHASIPGEGPRGPDSAAFEELARQATAAGQAGRTDDAIRNYESALKVNRQWDKGWADLGTLYYSSGKFPQAIAALKNSIAINPKNSQAWAFLGLTEFETKDYSNAYIHLDRAREMDFRGTPAVMLLAIYHLAELRNLNGDFFGAADLLIPEVHKGRVNEQTKIILGMSMLRVPLLPDQLSPSSRALMLAAGETGVLQYSYKYDDTFRAFERMTKDFPDTPFMHYAYASALDILSRYDEASSQLREEIRINPGSALPHQLMASIALKQHRPDDAMSASRHAVELESQSAGAHELLGRALLELGKVEPAVQELETASKLAPNYPGVHFSLARAYAKAKRPADAQRERAIFAQLNASSERDKSLTNQAYGDPHAQNEPPAAEARGTSQTNPQ
ncbi:MAG: tetratricopeptide repeat protein [Terriglobales bacterium]